MNIKRKVLYFFVTIIVIVLFATMLLGTYYGGRCKRHGYSGGGLDLPHGKHCTQVTTIYTSYEEAFN